MTNREKTLGVVSGVLFVGGMVAMAEGVVAQDVASQTRPSIEKAEYASIYNEQPNRLPDHNIDYEAGVLICLGGLVTATGLAGSIGTINIMGAEWNQRNGTTE
jgi:hypothetical protein